MEPTQAQLDQMMKMAGPAMRAMTVRVAHEFNTALLVCLRRLLKLFPAAAVDIQTAINALADIADNDTMFLEPMQRFTDLSEPHLQSIQTRDDEFVTTTARGIPGFAQCADLWEEATADTKRRVWGHVLKLCNISRNFREMERNKDQVFRNAFAQAAQTVNRLEQQLGRPPTLGDIQPLVMAQQQSSAADPQMSAATVAAKPRSPSP